MLNIYKNSNKNNINNISQSIIVLINIYDYFMWEEGMNTKPQIYYNNKHASTPQASKRKKRQVR